MELRPHLLAPPQYCPPSNQQSMFTDAGLFGQLKKALAERMLQAELTHYMELQRNGPEATRNHRNGSSKKSVLAAETKLELDIPFDRDGSFELQLMAKHQRRLPGFDERVISLYARSLSVFEIQGHLTERYGLEVSPPVARGDPFFAYPMEVQRIMYTTNAIESMNMEVRKIIKNRGHLPHDPVGRAKSPALGRVKIPHLLTV